jgi:hypothetical protein
MRHACVVVFCLAVSGFALSQDSPADLFGGYSHVKIDTNGLTAGGATPVAVIPLELVVNHLYIKASLNNSAPLSVLIDSGAPESLVDHTSAVQLGLPMSGVTFLQGFGGEGPRAVQQTTISQVVLDGARLNGVPAMSASTDFISRLLGHSTDAVIGSDLFNRYVVEVDYSDRLLRLYDPETYAAPNGGCQLPLSVDVYPMIHARLIDNDGNAIDAVFVVDTGSNVLVVTKSFGDAHPDLPLNGKTIGTAARKLLSGTTKGRVERVRAMKLADCVVANPIMWISEDVDGPFAGSQTISGFVGMNILQHFTTIIDFRHHVVTFRKTPTGDEDAQYDMTGMHLLVTGPSFHTFTVDQVLSGSVAAGGGILVGDQIESANHKPASQLPSSKVTDKLPRSPWMNSRIVAAFVSRMHSMISLPALSRTATEIVAW